MQRNEPDGSGDTRQYDRPQRRSLRAQVKRSMVVRWLWRNMNFYRVHLLAFCVVPVIVAIIFYLSNGQNKISFIDSLYLCVTSFTVNGLATVNLSTLTGFQQAIMYILMWAGHPITVSLIIIQSRIWIFEDHLEPLVRKRREERQARQHRKASQDGWSRRIFRLRRSHQDTPRSSDVTEHDLELTFSEEGKRGKVNASMIRRMSDAPQRINPSGYVMGIMSDPGPLEPPHEPILDQGQADVTMAESPRSMPGNLPSESPPAIEIRQPTGDRQLSLMMDTTALSPAFLRQSDSIGLSMAVRRGTREGLHSFALNDERGSSSALPRTRTVEFSPTRQARSQSIDQGRLVESPGSLSQDANGRRLSHVSENLGRPHYADADGLERHMSRQSAPFPRITTGVSMHRRGSLHTGFGGFPTPLRLLVKLISTVAPNTAERIRRRLTVPKQQDIKGVRTKSIASQTIEAALQTEHRQIEKDLEFLGGVEYKSLKLLRLIVICYHIGIQTFGFCLILIDSLQARFQPVFDGQPGYVSPVWFAVFQVTSAYTNTGTSLCDTSMVPFQSAHVMILVMFFSILAGNTAFPIFLRLIIWILKKSNRIDARIQEPLHFLLKHPRRCFIYLFPSHQTWFLLTMIVTLTITDWLCFLILDIGNPITEAVPVGTRVLIGLLQASAVRAAGFATIALSALAPAVKVLYVIMMYVSVYPIAMSVRSTNVYEEKSLGIFGDDDEQGSEASSVRSQEQRFGQREGESRTKVWGEYLLWHARQQLAFDMWWLAFSLWLICVIERGPLMDPENQSWFNIFTVLFEIVSAYGTVGMSLGVPYDNYSTSGAFSPLSKLVVCAVMIRGRHRGLPVAIDRAIVIPQEYNKKGGADGSNSLGRAELGVSSNAQNDGDVKRQDHTPANGLGGRTETVQRQYPEPLEPVPESTTAQENASKL